MGAGRAAVLRVMNHAKEVGVERMYLFTPDRMRLYWLLGWRPLETFAYSDGKIHTLMFIDL